MGKRYRQQSFTWKRYPAYYLFRLVINMLNQSTLFSRLTIPQDTVSDPD
jgi:hypothetical protein